MRRIVVDFVQIKFSVRNWKATTGRNCWHCHQTMPNRCRWLTADVRVTLSCLS